MNMIFTDTPSGWYQEKACNILASLSMVIEAHDRMTTRGDGLHWLYYHTMEYHFERAVFDTLRLLDCLTQSGGFANSANVKDICENGHQGFVNVIDGNMDQFKLEKK